MLTGVERIRAEGLPAVERLDEARPRGRTAIERAEVGRQREAALSGIVVERNAESAASYRWKP